MNMKILFLSIFLLLFLPLLVLGQTQLNPASTIFTVSPVYLAAPIQLSGTPSYLNIYWNSQYLSQAQTYVGVDCTLNCYPPSGLCGSAQYCSYNGLPGIGTCTITNPNYFYTKSNNVSCKFFDPNQANLAWPYVNVTFMPIQFSVATPAKITLTIGQTGIVQSYITNTGLFTDNYLTNISTFTPNIINIFPPSNATIGPLTGNSYQNSPQTGTIKNQISIYSTSGGSVCLTINSTAAVQIKLPPDNINSYYNCIQVTGGFLSLPDFQLSGIVQIVFFSSVLMFLALEIRKKSE